MSVPNKFSQEEYSCQRIIAHQIAQTTLQKTQLIADTHLILMNKARTRTQTKMLQRIHLRIPQATQHQTTAKTARI
jgi:hypothetical protein